MMLERFRCRIHQTSPLGGSTPFEEHSVAGGATGGRHTHFFTGAQARSPGRLSILRSVAAQSLRLVDWSLSPVHSALLSRVTAVLAANQPSCYVGIPVGIGSQKRRRKLGKLSTRLIHLPITMASWTAFRRMTERYPTCDRTGARPSTMLDHGLPRMRGGARLVQGCCGGVWRG